MNMASNRAVRASVVCLPDPLNMTSHCREEEYVKFLERLPIDPSFRARRQEYQRAFIECWPDLRDWLALPLPQRVGRLREERQANPSFPVSYRARTYLFFLAFTDRIRLDYDFLFALGNLRAVEITRPLGIDLGVEALAAEGARLGYKRQSITSSMMWVLPRLAMHTGIRVPNQLTAKHLDEMIIAIERFADRGDLDLYDRPTECFSYLYARCWVVKVRELQLLLHHRGRPVEAPRLIPCKRRPLPSPRPALQALVDRWLAVKRSTLSNATVDHLAISLRRFIEHIAVTAPELDTFAAVTPSHMASFLEAMVTEPRPRTGRPVSITGRRSRAGAVARFLADGAAWGWNGFPTRPVLDTRELPRLPQRVPRFIPADELAKLMEAIRTLACPFQRAALLTARWSGARRGEICRLALDCLDRYPDGTARLRIPAGKTLKERMVPLHEEAAQALREVIELRSGGPEMPLIDERTGSSVRYLFLRRGKRISAFYLFDHSLRDACRMAGLADGAGRATITAHRFRHTVGTQLAERGAKLHTVMSVLGHQSPHMSMVYARISDAEVLRDYQTVLGPGATIAGPGADAIRAGQLSTATVDWLRSNFLKTELELGHCLRLPAEGPCECDFYLSCAKFVTTPAYVPRLRERHRLELRLAEDARDRKWARDVERHSKIAQRIERLLTDLGEPLEAE